MVCSVEVTLACGVATLVTQARLAGPTRTADKVQQAVNLSVGDPWWERVVWLLP